MNSSLVPGCLLRRTMSYEDWMRTRYSVGSNVSARRFMLRAFSSDKHSDEVTRVTRALSLSDCYWVKSSEENVSFNDVTPYLNTEWDGSGVYSGGSISTLFANGASNKRWVDRNTLLKVNSFKEELPYRLCEALGIENIAKARISDDGLLVSNFTSPFRFFESLEQSGFVGSNDNAMETAVKVFREDAVMLFTIDYLVEHDDRHWGNYGFIRNADTGEYNGMSPYFDFDWAWSGGVVRLPEVAISGYSSTVKDICVRAKQLSGFSDCRDTINKRADELLSFVVT